MSDMELGELEGEKIYNPQDVVWVKLSSMWWPAEVEDQATLDPEVTEGLKKPPLCVVKFLLEPSYLHIKSLDHIYHYNCRKKKEFLINGFKKYSKNKNEKNVAIWPQVIQEAERRTGGDPDIINDPEIAPVVEKSDAEGRHGSKIRTSLPAVEQRGHVKRYSLPVDHFPSGSINGGRRDTKSSSDNGSCHALQHSRVFFLHRTPPVEEDKVPVRQEFYCESCDLRTVDLERYIFHFKMKHVSYARSLPPPQKPLSLPGPSKPKKERKRKEESASPIVKKKKKRSIVRKEQSPQPEMKAQPPSLLERSMECEQILQDWTDEDEEIKEGDKSSPPEDMVVVENTALQPTNEPENSLTDKNGTSNYSGEFNSKTVEAPVQPPKSSSCFDFDDEESAQPEVQTLKFGQKLPRVISPEKSKSSTAEILSDGLESFLNEVSVPELPSIPSLKHASTKGAKEGKKLTTSTAREKPKKTKDSKQGAFSTSINQTPDDQKDATPEVKSEDKHFLVEGPLQSKKRKGSGLTEGAEDGSAGKILKSCGGDDEPSRTDDALKIGDDGQLKELDDHPGTDVVKPSDLILIEQEFPSDPIKSKIAAELNDSDLACDVPSKIKSTISELDKQSLIDTLTYSPSSVYNDSSQKKRKKVKDELESSQEDEPHGKGGIVSELDKQSLIESLTHSPAPVDPITPGKKKMRHKLTSKSPKSPKLESQNIPETSNLRSGSKDVSFIESGSFPTSSHSRSGKIRGSSKAQITEIHSEVSPSPDVKFELKSSGTRKLRHSRPDDAGGTIEAIANSAPSSKPMMIDKLRKSLEKNDIKSSIGQAPDSKLDVSIDKIEDNLSNDSNKMKATSCIAGAVETSCIIKSLQSPSSSDQNETVTRIEVELIPDPLKSSASEESYQKNARSSRLRSSLKTEVVEASFKEQDSKKESDVNPEGVGDPKSDVLSGSCLAESDLSTSDKTLQKPLENSKIALEKNEFLEVSNLMPLKQNEIPKPSVLESSNSLTSPTHEESCLEKERKTKESTDNKRKDHLTAVGEQAVVIKKIKKSQQDECQKSASIADSPKKINKGQKGNPDNATKEEKRSKRTKESNDPSIKSPSKTVIPTDSNDGKYSRYKRSSRSDEKHMKTEESTSSSCSSLVPTSQERTVEDEGHSGNKRSSRSSDPRVEKSVESKSISIESGVSTTQDAVEYSKDGTPKEDKGQSKNKQSSRSSDSRVEKSVESESISIESSVPIKEDNVKHPKVATPKEDKGQSKNKRSSRSSDSRVEKSVESESISIESSVPIKEDNVKHPKVATPKEDKGQSKNKRSSRSLDSYVEKSEKSESISNESGVPKQYNVKHATPKEDKGHTKIKRSSRSSESRVEKAVEFESVAIKSGVPYTRDDGKRSKEDKGQSKNKRSSRSSDSLVEKAVESKSISIESVIPTTQDDVKLCKDALPMDDKGLSKNRRSSRSSDSVVEKAVESKSISIKSVIPTTQDDLKHSKDAIPKEDKGLSKYKRSSRLSDSSVEKAVESKSISIKSVIPTAQDDVKHSKVDKGQSKNKRYSRSSDFRVEKAVESKSFSIESVIPTTQDDVKHSKDAIPKEDKGLSKNRRSSRSSDTRVEKALEFQSFSDEIDVPTNKDAVKHSKDATPKEDKGHSRGKQSSHSTDTLVETKERMASPNKNTSGTPVLTEKERQAIEPSHSDHTKAEIIKSSKRTSKDKRNLKAATSKTEHFDELLKSECSTRSHDTQREAKKSSSNLEQMAPTSPTRSKRSSRSHVSRVETLKSVVSTTKEEPSMALEVTQEPGTAAVSDDALHSINKQESRSRESEVEHQESVIGPCKRIIPVTALDEVHSVATTLTDNAVRVHSKSKRSSRSRDCQDGLISSPSENISSAIEIDKDGKHSSTASPSATDGRGLPGSDLSYVRMDTFASTVVPCASPKKGISANLGNPKEVIFKSEIETSDSMSSLSKDISESPSKAGIVSSSDETTRLSKIKSTSDPDDGIVETTDPVRTPSKAIPSTPDVPSEVAGFKSKRSKSSILSENIPEVFCSTPYEMTVLSKTRIPVTSNKSIEIQEMKPPLRRSMRASSRDAKSLSAEESKVPVPTVEQKAMVQLRSEPDMLSSNEAHSGNDKTDLINQESSQDQESPRAITLQVPEPTETSVSKCMKEEREVPAVCDTGASVSHGNKSGFKIATSLESMSESPQSDVISVDSSNDPEPVVKKSISSSILGEVQSPSAVKIEERTGEEHSTTGEPKIEVSTDESFTKDWKLNEMTAKGQYPSAEKIEERIKDILAYHTTSEESKIQLSTGTSVTKGMTSNETPKKTNIEKDFLLPSPSLNLILTPESRFKTPRTLECTKMEEGALQLVGSHLQPLVPSPSDFPKDSGLDSSERHKESPAELSAQIGSSIGEVIVLPADESIAPIDSPVKSVSSFKEGLQKVGDAAIPSPLSSQRLKSESSKLESEKTEDYIFHGAKIASFEKTSSPTKPLSSGNSSEESQLPNVTEKVEPKMSELPPAPLVTARASRWDNPFPMRKSETRPSTPTNLFITSPTKMSVSPVTKVKVEIKSGLGRSCFKSPPPDLKCVSTDAEELASDWVSPQTVEVGSIVDVETTHTEPTATAGEFDDELSALQAEIASYSESKVQGDFFPKPDSSDDTKKADLLRLETTKVGSNVRDLKTDKIEKTVEGKSQNSGTQQAHSTQDNSLVLPALPEAPKIKSKNISLSPSKVPGLSEAALLASLLKGDDEEPNQPPAINVASPKKEVVKPLPPLPKSVQALAKAAVFEKPDDSNRGVTKTKSNLLRPIVTNFADIPVVISSIPLPLSEPLISSSQQAPIVIPVEAPKVSTHYQVPNKLCLEETPTSRVEVLEVERSEPQAGLVGGIDPSKLLDINDMPFVLEEDLIEEGLMTTEPCSMQTIASNMDSISSTAVTESSASCALDKNNIVSSTATESEETFAIEDLVEEVVEEEPATDSTLTGNVVSEKELTTGVKYERIYEARQVRQIFIEVVDDSDPNFEFLCSLPVAPFGIYAPENAALLASLTASQAKKPDGVQPIQPKIVPVTLDQTPTPVKKVDDVQPIQPKSVTTPVTTEPKLVSLASGGKLVSGVSGASPQIIRLQTIKPATTNKNITPADLERQKVQVASSSQPVVPKKEPLQLQMVKDAKTGATKFMVKPQLVQQRSKTACKQLVMSQQMKSIVKSPASVVASNTLGNKNPSLIQINKGSVSTSKLLPRGTTPSILGPRRVVRQPLQIQRSSSIPIQRPSRSRLASDLLVGSSTMRLPLDQTGLILSDSQVLPEIRPANQVLMSGSNQLVLGSAAHQPTGSKMVSFVVNKPPEPKKPGKDLLEQALTGLDVQNDEASNIMPTATVVYGMLTDSIQQRPIMTTAVQPSQVILSQDQLITFETPNEQSSAVSETNR